MSIKATSMTKKELFIYTTTPFDDRPTANAKKWPDAPLTGKLNAYIVDEYEYKGRPAYQTFLQVDGKWYKSSSAHVRFLMTQAYEAFGADLIDELAGVKMYKVPSQNGDAAELEFILN